ncbi:DMT family transporter [bacterium]|nr:DMT family transporter [bacterium]
MIESRIGEFAALTTAICWTFGALAFEVASKRAGSLAVNWLRLVIGLIFLSLFCWIYRGSFLPVDANSNTWFWLSLSGIIGFTVGDLLLFEAFVVVGARISMLIMSTVPPITALIGWIALGETLSFCSLTGMTLTVGGIVLVVLQRHTQQNQFRHSIPVWGVFLASGGALGQAIGLVLSKHGMGDYDAFASTQIRIIAGIIGISLLFFMIKRWHRVGQVIRNREALLPTSLGAFLGPFLGVSFSLLAVQHTATGIASTIMALVPILIIPPAVIFLKEKVNLQEIIGAVISVLGVSLLFL